MKNYKILHISVLIVAMFMLILSVSVVEAKSLEYPFIYKSPRIMGMGGANVAIGGTFDSVFQNPAGLGRMPENNWEFNLLGISATVSTNAVDFANDLSDALDTEDVDGNPDIGAVSTVLVNNQGKNMHIGMNDLTSVANNFGKVSFGIGAFGGMDANIIAHQGFGSEGLLEIDGWGQAGTLMGFGYKFNDNLIAGIDLKYIMRERVEHFFTARELTAHQNDMDTFLQDEVAQNGNGVGVDAGVIYEFAKESWAKPSFGLSVLNIGNMKLGNAGELPMSVNAGVAVKPELSYVNGLTLGLDYVDMLSNYDQDKDIAKRIRLGGELRLFDRWYSSIALRTGLYQGYLTYGADVRLLMVSLTYASYAEEVGAYAGQVKDRRHMAMLNVGW